MNTVEVPLSLKLVESLLVRYSPDRNRWHHENALVLKAIDTVRAAYSPPELLPFLQRCIDPLLVDGGIRGYCLEEYKLDQVSPGKILLSLWQQTGEDRYRRAAEVLRSQLHQQPRTSLGGGYWHRKLYPDQMWLDGLYQYLPFLAQYSALFGSFEDFHDIVAQFELMEEVGRDPRSGLLCQGWDSSRAMPWSHPETGRSPHPLARSMGLFGMALVDTLEWVPANHPRRGKLIAILERFSGAMIQVQDPSTGLWYQVLDQGHRAGNFLESSASAMMAFALAKAARLGHLSGPATLTVARRAFESLVTSKLQTDGDGHLVLVDVCGIARLGGRPYRDGSFDYYVGERLATDDFKSLAALALAAVEIEAASR